MELSKPGFTSCSLSRKDERIAKSAFLQMTAGELAGFFLALHAGLGERESVNTHWSLVAGVYLVIMAYEDEKRFL